MISCWIRKELQGGESDFVEIVVANYASEPLDDIVEEELKGLLDYWRYGIA